MSKGWKVSIGSSSVTIDSFAGQASSEVWAEIGQAARSIIHEDTQDGKDWNGKRFVRYSKLYGRTRKAAGRPTRPDLTNSGNMLNSMAVVSQSPTSVTLGFLDRPETGRTLLEKAWPKLSAKDKRAYAGLAAIAKRKAGKSARTAGRSNPSARKGKRRSVPGMPKSDGPRLLPAEKMLATNKLRPWFGFGRKGSKRRRLIQTEGFQIYIEGLTRRGAGRN